MFYFASKKTQKIGKIVEEIYNIKDVDIYSENVFLKDMRFQISPKLKESYEIEVQFYIFLDTILTQNVIEKYNLVADRYGKFFRVSQDSLISNENWNIIALKTLENCLAEIQGYSAKKLLGYLEKKGEFTFILKIPQVTQEIPIELFKKMCGNYIKVVLENNFYVVSFEFENYSNRNKKCLMCKVDSLQSIFNISEYIENCEYCEFLESENK